MFTRGLSIRDLEVMKEPDWPVGLHAFPLRILE